MTTHTQLHDLLPIYALDALEGIEQRQMGSHVTACRSCAVELDRFHEVAAQLTEEVPVSENLWGRIATAIEESEHPGKTLRLLQRRPSPWNMITLGAAALALIAGIAAVYVQDDSPLPTVAQIASNPNATDVSLNSDGVEIARVVLSPTGQGLVIPDESLQSLDGSRTYQLWVLNGNGEAISAGVLGNKPTVARFTWTGEVSGFALTREVAGGVVSSAGDVAAVVTDL